MIAFLDFQIKTSHRVYIPHEDKVYKVNDDALLNFLKRGNINEVYVESASKKFLYRLLNNGIQVYILRNKNQNNLRKKYSLRKSHENDAKLLYKIFKEDPNSFRKYVKRQLNNDPEIQLYVLILKEIKRVKQKIKTNQRFNLPVEELNRYLKRLLSEQMKLLYNLKKKYNNILNLFRDIKGLAGGNLLYFLTLIPEIKSFKSARSFLRYLGLRNVEINKFWNREARQVLIRIAIKTSRYSNIEFNPRKPNWKYLRELAITIYTRLRDNEVNIILSPPYSEVSKILSPLSLSLVSSFLLQTFYLNLSYK